jgi:hypothetical protein
VRNSFDRFITRTTGFTPRGEITVQKQKEIERLLEQSRPTVAKLSELWKANQKLHNALPSGLQGEGHIGDNARKYVHGFNGKLMGELGYNKMHRQNFIL